MAKRCYGCMKQKEKSPVCEHCGYNENVPNEPHQLPIGTVLQGRYQVGKKLGQGGFGITYIGWDQSLETPVAIKEYYPGSLVNRDCGQTLAVSCNGSNVSELYALNRERFLREARILAMLSRVPGIVRVQNLFEANNTAYIVMEYVDGIDLKHYIRMQGRTLTVEEVFAVMRPVMYALSKVHDAELVHRDISPDNIMIQKDGSIVLLDFGAARQVENADVHKNLTRSTQTILKHGFAPIEQYRSRGNLGPWTDVYALCATMYYCLTGKVPSEAPERVMGDDNVNWRQIPGLTEQQVAVLETGMAMIPEKRVQSVKELYQALFGERRTTAIPAQPKKPEPEAIPAPPVEKPMEAPAKEPAKVPGKKPAEYPTHTVALEEAAPAPRTKEPTAPAPVVMETKPKKKKKPVGIIVAAVLAVVAAVGLFVMRPKDAEVEAEMNVPETEATVVAEPPATIIETQDIPVTIPPIDFKPRTTLSDKKELFVTSAFYERVGAIVDEEGNLWAWDMENQTLYDTEITNVRGVSLVGLYLYYLTNDGDVFSLYPYIDEYVTKNKKWTKTQCFEWENIERIYGFSGTFDSLILVDSENRIWIDKKSYNIGEIKDVQCVSTAISGENDSSDTSYTILIQTNNGEYYGYGNNVFGNFIETDVPFISSPVKLNIQDIANIAIFRTVWPQEIRFAFVSNNGELTIYNAQGSTVNKFNSKVVDIVSHESSLYVLNENDKLFGYGAYVSNVNLTKNSFTHTQFVEISEARDLTGEIWALGLGGWECFAVTNNGEVHFWGQEGHTVENKALLFENGETFRFK